uniref:Uncharacterized protein n=1 Tax=Daucus carota subsp. sativus TaxID=79200 RepID=A0A161XXX3_DAUCS
MSKGNLKAEWDVFFDTLAKVFAPTNRKNFGNISLMLQIFGFSIAYNRRINFGKILLREIIRKMGSVTQRSVHQNEKVECFYPMFLMLFLNDKMNEADRNMYVDSPVVPIQRICAKIQTRMVNKKKHDNVPLVVTPLMLEQFSAPFQPIQVPEPLQQQQYQPQQQQQAHPDIQQEQLQQQSPPQNPQPLQLLQDYQSSSQSSHYSPYNPPYNSPHQSPHQSSYNSPHQSHNQSPSHYNFFPDQQASIFPSQSEPIPSPTHIHTIPQPQSTSQPLPADSAINPDVQDFRTDLQVAQVLSNLTDTFNIDIADFDCDIGFDF